MGVIVCCWSGRRPFFIDWLDCVHPAMTSPSGCLIKRLEINCSDTTSLNTLVGAVDQRVVIQSSEQTDRTTLCATLDSPNGEVCLTPLSTAVDLF